MVFPSIHNEHWSIESTILLESDEDLITINNKLSSILSINDVIDYTLTTRGDFLQLSVIEKVSKCSAVIVNNI